MEITQQQQWEFERAGVIRLGEVLSAVELAELRPRLEAAVFDSAGAPRDGVRDLSERRGRPLTYAMLQLVDLHRRDAAFAALARRPDVLSAVSRLLGPDLRLFRDQAFYKPPNSDGEVYLHQDNRYWRLEPPNAVTLWLALDDATVANGCLHFIRGSHLRGRVEHRQAAAGESVLLEAQASCAQAEPIELPAGHATLHHCQTLHFSPPNRTSAPRRAHTMVFIGEGVRSRRQDLPDPVPMRLAAAEGKPWAG
jgi:ectoine hydroxylase-related dioxygenase (phytanoyl-CoA dioxygenase family)